jgi:hypothetical protein
VTCLFPLQSSVILLTAGMAVYMLLGPYAEAAEQTILQKVVPYERQGRVFGFAQSVELAASPLTAFLIGPITQLIFIPFMTTGAGADMIGGWFGTGPDRGIALVFVLPGCSAWCVLAAGPALWQLGARRGDCSRLNESVTRSLGVDQRALEGCHVRVLSSNQTRLVPWPWHAYSCASCYVPLWTPAPSH